MTKERVAVYFDGFNIYHAIDDLKASHLKWLNLAKLSNALTKTQSQTVVSVQYFSAIAHYYQNTPLEGRIRRHQTYIRALECKGVICQLGNFAKRDMSFKAKNYRATWRRREEKQTDVAIGVSLVRDAFLDVYDAAYVVSCDTDMLPAMRVVKNQFPNKRIVTVAPPSRSHHRDLLLVCDGNIVIKRSQVERCLFGRQVVSGGRVAARRPPSYKPP